MLKKRIKLSESELERERAARIRAEEDLVHQAQEAGTQTDVLKDLKNQIKSLSGLLKEESAARIRAQEELEEMRYRFDLFLLLFLKIRILEKLMNDIAYYSVLLQIPIA